MADFQELYTRLRQKEGRVYSDSEIQTLPNISSAHKLYKEWCIRKKSAERFLDYINSKEYNTAVEIGCGIGWFSNYLAANASVNVLGIDIHPGELATADNVFKAANLEFKELDILTSDMPFKADCIVINGAVQYFKNLDVLFDRISRNLALNGEVHIIDSPIHRIKTDAKLAEARTKAYYDSMGVGELSKFFNHHSIDDLPKHTELYSYGTLEKIQNKLGASNSPFPWIRINSTELCS